ncbi:hypothetical protein [Bosea sp. BK604]|uniref:hypothetical protein n=1 Tax=Bosea sp. BK604 TaxID=2512180 RepID=UPI001046283A|nr:hypothetical protein [Bosea sp. BK604]TCR60937.1 hypothetical protein EV560_115162 [Bosea sp. BK604]
MADENLRLRAEVVDAFSGPLRTLRSMLQGVSSAAPTEKLKSGMEGATRAATAFGREINNTVTPALNAAGIAGLTVSGVLAGVGLAVRSFTGATAGLALLSRETNMTVQSMRVLEEVGKRFNVAPEAMQQTFRQFAENSRLFRKGLGDTFTWLNSQGGVTSRWAQQLRADLNAGLNPDEAYKRSLQFMRRIRDPIERGLFAERLFGNRQLGLLGSEDIGKLIDDVEKKLGQLPKGAVESAMELKRSWDDFITSMVRMRDTAAVTILPMLKDITDATEKWLNNPETKTGIKAFFHEIEEGAKAAFSSVKTFVDVLNAVREGRFLDAVKLLNSKPVFAPSVQNSVPFIGEMGRGDTGPLIERRDQLRRQIDVMDNLISRKESEPDPLGNGNMTASEERRKRDRLIQELEALTRELEQLRKDRAADATVQQQSLTGDGSFGGARLQLAALGGVAQAGRMSGISVPRLGGVGGAQVGAGGSRSWRNNNPGNLEYGPFAQSMGATGTDGRFAIFPDYATGRRAQEKLLFESKNYRDLNLGQAINRWAPGSENNVPAYLRALGGFDPSKPMSAYTPTERSRLLDAMQRHEGWQVGDPSGLRIKPGQGFSGGGVHGGVLDIARSIQAMGGIERFTAFNDRYHAGTRSRHAQGLAGDFTLTDPRQSAAMAERVREMLRASGLRDGKDFSVLDEYTNPSARATAGHLHFELKSREAAEAYRRHVQRERRERENADRRMEGAATLDVNFRNAPAGMSTSTSMSGMFKDIRLRQVVRPPKAGVDI